LVHCSEGHENADDQTFCGTCGRLLGEDDAELDDGGVSVGDLTADAFFVAMSLVGLASLVMFIAALFGAGRANQLDKFDTYAYISAIGAGTWLLATLIAWGLAAWRVNVLRER
jgi:hypothetical protein